MNYPALVGSALAESRRKGHSFERAWRDVMDAHPRPKGDTGFNSQGARGWAHETLEFAKRAFEAGYYRRKKIGRRGSIRTSLIAERDHLYVDHVYETPAFEGERKCGWGDGCDNAAREGGWLCEAHKAIVRVPAVQPLCLHPGCHHSKNTAPNNALPYDDYCKRHRAEVDQMVVAA